MTRLLLFLSLLLPVVVGAQGGPPLLTDDPGTVETGKWEINIAWITRALPGRRENEIPHFDANRGISDRAHFKVEIPWVFASEDGSTLDGDGGGSIGVKWRFLEGKGSRPAVSTYPQLGFSLATRSVRLGLSEGGTSLLLPVQVEWDFRSFSLNPDFGILFQQGTGIGWLAGFAIGRHFPGTDLLAELHGEGLWSTGEANWVAQLGLRRDLCEQATLLFAFGRTIMETRSDRLSWTSYLGVQLHY
ncbi:MAG TPA: hypothetical protein VHE55_08150 [Fimbriimonadaceae bacterium]|nr:hypothetical protein [Fimbriimonadaceae bacterium]